jgi:DNA-binding MarR family transcriptional regulator
VSQVKIEDAIKQNKQFNSEFERLVVNIMFTSGWLEGTSIQRLKPFGISPQQFNVLRILRGSRPNPCSLGQVTARMIDKNSNATRLVEKLRLKGLVKRELCPNNRRQVDIEITNQGLKLLDEIDINFDQWYNTNHPLNDKEMKLLNSLLDKLRG